MVYESSFRFLNCFHFFTQVGRLVRVVILCWIEFTTKQLWSCSHGEWVLFYSWNITENKKPKLTENKPWIDNKLRIVDQIKAGAWFVEHLRNRLRKKLFSYNTFLKRYTVRVQYNVSQPGGFYSLK